MRAAIVATIAALGLAGFSVSGAFSMPTSVSVTAPETTGHILLVREGCGPGGFRTGSGRCVYPGRYHRRCPFGMHMNRWGHCRPD
jgi:hypothetical protein